MPVIHAHHDKGLRGGTLLGRVSGVKFPEDVPLLSDGVVILRAHTPDDARGSYEQCQDPLSQAWTTVPVPYSMVDAREFVEGIVPKGWREDRDYAFAVEAPDADGTLRYAGTVSLRPEGSRRAEIAYGSHPWCRGRGVMERALRLLLDWGFDELDLAMVVWWANQGNWASRRLAWRLGFTLEGAVRSWLPQRGELRDAWVGSLLRDDKREPGSDWYDVPVIHGRDVVLRGYRAADAATASSRRAPTRGPSTGCGTCPRRTPSMTPAPTSRAAGSSSPAEAGSPGRSPTRPPTTCSARSRCSTSSRASRRRSATGPTPRRADGA
jgi:RimJ/RimL family protein N-acetyltransferase